MFEEVPCERRRRSRVTATRVALGPFVVGGGVLLATLGGSVALAATVITAGTIAVHDGTVAARRTPIIRPSVTAAAAAVARRSGGPGRGGSARSAWPSLTSTSGLTRPGPGPDTGPGPAPLPTVSVALGSMAGSASGSAATALPDSPPPTGAPAGPSGNALVFVTGYDRLSDRLTYRYATVSDGSGPANSDVYRVAGPTVYFAGLAPEILIRSGGGICQPAGGECTPSQLVTAAPSGFFAEIAVDPTGLLHSVIERDNAQSGSGPAPSATPSPSPSASTATEPSASASPSVS